MDVGLRTLASGSYLLRAKAQGKIAAGRVVIGQSQDSRMEQGPAYRATRGCTRRNGRQRRSVEPSEQMVSLVGEAQSW